jgi:hypothetical protein
MHKNNAAVYKASQGCTSRFQHPAENESEANENTAHVRSLCDFTQTYDPAYHPASFPDVSNGYELEIELTTQTSDPAYPPHELFERAARACIARDLNELRDRSLYTSIKVARTSH